jgi:hypothetical protein
MHEIIGYHGTSVDSAVEIIKSNYKQSCENKEWLGDGIYFFINGISSKPDEQAKEWAIAQAWDNNKKEYIYNSFCVIKTDIQVEEENLLDLTKEEGVEVLNYLIDSYEHVIKSENRKVKYAEGLIINLARGEGILPIDVVKGNFYIKFAKERIKNINLRTNNCTICAVYEPNKNIIKNNIIKTGEIKYETI